MRHVFRICIGIVCSVWICNGWMTHCFLFMMEDKMVIKCLVFPLQNNSISPSESLRTASEKHRSSSDYSLDSKKRKVDEKDSMSRYVRRWMNSSTFIEIHSSCFQTCTELRIISRGAVCENTNGRVRDSGLSLEFLQSAHSTNSKLMWEQSRRFTGCFTASD